MVLPAVPVVPLSSPQPMAPTVLARPNIKMIFFVIVELVPFDWEAANIGARSVPNQESAHDKFASHSPESGLEPVSSALRSNSFVRARG